MLLETFNTIITSEGSVTEQNVKGQALMCAGKLASSCGKENFPEAAITAFTNFALECLKHDNKFELRETSITYFSDLSVLIKEDMAPVFETVITEILKTCEKDEEFKETLNEKKEGQGISLDSDSEQGDGMMGINVDVNSLDEKSAAINALGIIAMNSPKLFQTKMKQVIETLEKLHFYFHENIKFHVVLAYEQIAIGLMKLNGVMDADDKFNWTKGAPDASPLPAQVVELLNTIVFPYFWKLFDDEDQKAVIERVLENMREMCEDFGPALFAQ